MARRLLSAVARALRTDAEAPVHFHQGPTGDPACCYDQHCASPRLEVA